MMESARPSRIQEHTLETLCRELISGRPVADDTGHIFSFADRDTRSLLEWFRLNRKVWDGQNRAEHVEGLIAALADDPPEQPQLMKPKSPQKLKRYRLRTLRAFRFGGLHEFGTLHDEPEVFEHDFSPDAVCAWLLYGRNGSGKSSLLSAICWCLTGWYFCPQGAPRSSDDVVQFEADHDSATEGDAVQIAAIRASPIVPLPSADVVRELEKGKINVPTWVEIEFVDDANTVYGPFRRTLTLKGGKVDVVAPDLSALGITNANIEVGTRLPAVLPHIKLDDKSDLGTAVARLIDIQPLVNVARHAKLASDKLRKEWTEKYEQMRAAARADFDLQFAKVMTAIEQTGIPELRTASTAAQDVRQLRFLESLEATISSLRGTTLQAAEAVLNGSVDFTDKRVQQSLIDNVPLALARIRPDAICELPSMRIWRALDQLSADDVQKSEAIVTEIEHEAAELAELSVNPLVAYRVRLYARIASWLREQDDESPPDSCPICGGNLEASRDHATGRPVLDHLRDCLASKKQFTEWTITKWAADVRNRLHTQLPAALRSVAAVSPGDLLCSALQVELLDDDCFNGVLAPLKPPLQDQLTEMRRAFPAGPPSGTAALPELIVESVIDLQSMLISVRTGINQARWVHENHGLYASLTMRTVGTVSQQGDDVPAEQGTTDGETVAGRLISLRRVIAHARPLTELLSQVAVLSPFVRKESAAAENLMKVARTIAGIKPLIGLKELVERQVQGLLTRLQSSRDSWLKRIYRAHRVHRPEVSRTHLTADGKLGFDASLRGARTRAHHVTNSSALRATLVAFWLAYWEDQLRSDGGLRLLMLDDPQELFDLENQQLLARAIPELYDDAQLLLASNDRFFLDAIEGHPPASRRSEICWGMHPSPLVQIVPFPAELDVLVRDFKNAVNNDSVAVRLVSRVRVYIETRLLNLFRYQQPLTLQKKPTLDHIFSELRRLAGLRTQPFDSCAISALLAHCAADAESNIRKLFNDSLHGKSHLISYGRVEPEMPHVERTLDLVNQAWDDFHCSSRKSVPELAESASIARSKISEPKVCRFPATPIPQITALAAAKSDCVTEEAAVTGGLFHWQELGECAVFQVTTDSLGLAVKRNHRIIVSLSGEPPRDHSLVIALRGNEVFARRLLLVPDRADSICLVSDAIDPRRRPPQCVDRIDNLRVLPIIGVIWDDTPPKIRIPGEAHEIGYDFSQLPVLASHLVRGDSAIPAVLNGQSVLVGAEIAWAALKNNLGAFAAVELQNGDELLKVVGPETIGPNGIVREFKPIGGMGDSRWVRGPSARTTKAIARIPEVRRIRHALGVLFTDRLRRATIE